MIFNLSGDDIQGKIEKFISFDSYDTFITDAVHIYSYGDSIGASTDGTSTVSPWRNYTTVWLTWRPGDPVEPTPTVSNAEKIRATTTLLIDPYALTNATNVYIPYATTVETFNSGYRWSSDGSDDNLVYTQQCFSTTATIHVNATLRAYMANHSEVWGEIINNITADL